MKMSMKENVDEDEIIKVEGMNIGWSLILLKVKVYRNECVSEIFIVFSLH